MSFPKFDFSLIRTKSTLYLLAHRVAIVTGWNSSKVSRIALAARPLFPRCAAPAQAPRGAHERDAQEPFGERSRSSWLRGGPVVEQRSRALGSPRSPTSDGDSRICRPPRAAHAMSVVVVKNVCKCDNYLPPNSPSIHMRGSTVMHGSSCNKQEHSFFCQACVAMVRDSRASAVNPCISAG